MGIDDLLKKMKKYQSKIPTEKNFDKEETTKNIDFLSQDLNEDIDSGSLDDYDIIEDKYLIKVDKLLNFVRNKQGVVKNFREFIIQKYIFIQKVLYFFMFIVSIIQSLFFIGMNKYIESHIIVVIFRIFYGLLLIFGIHFISIIMKKKNFIQIYKITSFLLFFYGMLTSVVIIANIDLSIEEFHITQLLEMIFIYFAFTNLKFLFIFFFN